MPLQMDESGRFFNPEQDIDKHRNSLPHWQQDQVWCFVTWRLADSLPGPLLQQWKKERDFWLRKHPPPWDRETEALYHRRFSRQMDQWLDQGIGSCFLRSPELAVLVAGTLQHSDREQYLLRDFVVMPNHVHVLFLPLGDHSLASILKLWKGVSARQINRTRGSTGPVWQEDYWDRLIRNEAHFERAVSYIRENPVKAGLKKGEFLLV